MKNNLFARVGAVRQKPIFLSKEILIPASSIIEACSNTEAVQKFKKSL